MFVNHFFGVLTFLSQGTKQLRAIDVPMVTLRLLHHLQHKKQQDNTTTTDNNGKDENWVERAYIPSLGLSNKGSSTAVSKDSPVMDNDDIDLTHNNSILDLPLERDLSVTISSLHYQKMCLWHPPARYGRLWDVDRCFCVDILKVCILCM